MKLFKVNERKLIYEKALEFYVSDFSQNKMTIWSLIVSAIYELHPTLDISELLYISTKTEENFPELFLLSSTFCNFYESTHVDSLKEHQLTVLKNAIIACNNNVSTEYEGLENQQSPLLNDEQRHRIYQSTLLHYHCLIAKGQAPSISGCICHLLLENEMKLSVKTQTKIMLNFNENLPELFSLNPSVSDIYSNTDNGTCKENQIAILQTAYWSIDMRKN